MPITSPAHGARRAMLHYATLLLLIACRAPAPQGSELDLNAAAKSGTLAVHVGRGGITIEQLRAKLDQLGAGKERYRDPKELRAFVDNQVRFELLAEEAMRRGLDRDPEVQETARRTMVQKLVSTALETKEPSDAEVEAAYQQSLADYRQPERVQLAAFVVKTLAEAEQTVGKLRQAQTAPADQRYLSESELVSAFGAQAAQAIFTVKDLGTVGPIVKVNTGFLVFKLTGRRAAFARPLAEVSSGIKQRIARQRRNDAFEALISRLRNEVPVTIDESKLQEVWKVAAPASQPASTEVSP